MRPSAQTFIRVPEARLLVLEPHRPALDAMESVPEATNGPRGDGTGPDATEPVPVPHLSVLEPPSRSSSFTCRSSSHTSRSSCLTIGTDPRSGADRLGAPSGPRGDANRSSSLASRSSSLAIGTGSVASGTGSVTFGSSSLAIGTGSVASGTGSRTIGTSSVAIGSSSLASGPVPSPRGPVRAPSGPEGLPERTARIAIRSPSFTFGSSSLAIGTGSVASRTGSRTIGTSSFTIGTDSVASRTGRCGTRTGSVTSGTGSVAPARLRLEHGCGGNVPEPQAFRARLADVRTTCGRARGLVGREDEVARTKGAPPLWRRRCPNCSSFRQSGLRFIERLQRFGDGGVFFPIRDASEGDSEPGVGHCAGSDPAVSRQRSYRQRPPGLSLRPRGLTTSPRCRPAAARELRRRW